ncbi:MAG: glycosyltransferase [Candidatus Synoicihabitans palmerolidicus]|nr:glycosyltransferase [Candidatus Synoicihabitans palmerolidicus]
MRVILTSHGSTGDIYPVIALAVAMQQAGHQVRFATIPHYREDVQAAGIEFLPLCPDWEQADLSYRMGLLQKIHTPIYQLRELYVEAHKYIPEIISRMNAAMPETDLVVSSYLFPMNKGIADRHGVPFATLAFAPHVIPSPDYPPENMPSPRWLGRGLRRAWNRRMWQTANAIVDRVINGTVASSLRTAGLPKVRNFSPNPLNASSSPCRPNSFARVMPRSMRAFVLPALAAGKRPSTRNLIRKSANSPVANPCQSSLSVAWFTTTPVPSMERFVRHWPVDQKIIVQRGWAQFPKLCDETHIKVIGKVSHDQLFRHASVIIHHGGAGTTASALHAGKPQIIVPAHRRPECLCP